MKKKNRAKNIDSGIDCEREGAAVQRPDQFIEAEGGIYGGLCSVCGVVAGGREREDCLATRTKQLERHDEMEGE